MPTPAAELLEWNDEQRGLLRVLWDEGLSTAAIGLRLGTTKNAIIGKARRIGLTPRKSPIVRSPVYGPPPPPRPRWPGPRETLPPLPSTAAEEAVANLRALTVAYAATQVVARAAVVIRLPAPRPAPRESNLRCQWLDGERWAYEQCERKALLGYSYCLGHRARCYLSFHDQREDAPVRRNLMEGSLLETGALTSEPREAA